MNWPSTNHRAWINLEKDNYFLNSFWYLTKTTGDNFNKSAFALKNDESKVTILSEEKAEMFPKTESLHTVPFTRFLMILTSTMNRNQKRSHHCFLKDLTRSVRQHYISIIKWLYSYSKITYNHFVNWRIQKFPVNAGGYVIWSITNSSFVAYKWSTN